MQSLSFLLTVWLSLSDTSSSATAVGLVPASLIAPDVSFRDLYALTCEWCCSSKLMSKTSIPMVMRRVQQYRRLLTQRWGLLSVCTHTSTSTASSRITFPSLCWICGIYAASEQGCLHGCANADSAFALVAGATRIGALGVTGIAIFGLTKLNLAGPGLTPTVKKLWTSAPATATT